MKTFKGLIFLGLFIGCTYALHAAPPPPPGGSPACWPPPCIPIDGGLSFLVAAGAAYGAKKIYDSRKKSSKIS